jgi:hypothetical protein
MILTIRPLSTIKFIGLSETNTIGYYGEPCCNDLVSRVDFAFGSTEVGECVV